MRFSVKVGSLHINKTWRLVLHNYDEVIRESNYSYTCVIDLLHIRGKHEQQCVFNMNNNVCSAVLLGHSFIRRLNDFMKDNPSYYNLRLYENLFDIQCRAQGGHTVFRLIHERYDLYDFGHFTPTIIYLQIGGTGAWGMDFVSSSPFSLLPPFFQNFHINHSFFKIFIIIRFFFI